MTDHHSRQSLERAVSGNVSMAGVLRALGLKQGGGTQRHLKQKIQSLGISTAHFRRLATNYGAAHKGGVPRKRTYDSSGQALLYCAKCDAYKHQDQFGFKRKASGVRQSQCKQCHKTYAAGHYKSNKAAYAQRARCSAPRVAARNREWLQEHKATKPCMDCGGKFHPCAMDFDHREGEAKRFNVSRMASRLSLEAIQTEIAKCDLVCSNCHRVRTFVRYHARVAQSRGNRLKPGVVSVRDRPRVPEFAYVAPEAER